MADINQLPVLICTAWPYANGSLHVGHLAGVYVPADVFARYQRLRGRNVLMVSGTDAHGTPVTVRAEQEGVDPRSVAERYHSEFLSYWRDLNINFDLYASTMTDTHREVVQAQFRQLLAKQVLFAAKSIGFFDPVAKRFLPDTYIEGECPHCGYDQARGNQCENCGRLLEPDDLGAPRSRLNPGAVLEKRETEHFYLDLPQFESALTEWVRRQSHWRPNVHRWTLNFLQGGLQPRAITRDINWGVPVPLDGWDTKRIYVWFEACTGYLSATIDWARRTGRPQEWETWWKEPRCRQYYFLGKDNIPFHTVIWPAILLGRGDTILPYDIPANEYMNSEGQKASKSAGIGASVPSLLAAFDSDAIRYYVIANAPETGDTEYSHADFVRRNNELAGVWGNLVHRTLTFVQRSFDASVPTHVIDPEVESAILEHRERVEALLDRVQLRQALLETMALARFGNEWFDRRKPWDQVKVDRRAAADTIGSSVTLLNALKVLFSVFIPKTSTTLHTLLGCEGTIEDLGWAFEPAVAGRRLPPPTPLLRKLDAPD